MTDTRLHRLQRSYSRIDVYLFAEGENDRGRPKTWMYGPKSNICPAINFSESSVGKTDTTLATPNVGR